MRAYTIGLSNEIYSSITGFTCDSSAFLLLLLTWLLQGIIVIVSGMIAGSECISTLIHSYSKAVANLSWFIFPRKFRKFPPDIKFPKKIYNPNQSNITEVSKVRYCMVLYFYFRTYSLHVYLLALSQAVSFSASQT